MSERKLVILGTAAQVPTRERNHSGYFLYWDRFGFLVDPGEGTQRQMSRFNVKASMISKILLTHFHGDHCLGLPGIIQRMALDGVQHTVDIYFPASGTDYYQHLLAASFHHNQVDLSPHPIKDDGIVFQDEYLSIQAYHLNHPIETVGYRIKEHDGLSLDPQRLEETGLKGSQIGQLKATGQASVGGKVILASDVGIPKQGQCVSFVMDTSYCENAVTLARHADVLLCESTFSTENADLATAYGHLTAEQAAIIAVESGARQLVLTHFSQRYPNTHGLLQEAKKYHHQTAAANDGDVFELPPRKKIHL